MHVIENSAVLYNIVTMDLSKSENIIILNWNNICRICLNDTPASYQIIDVDKEYKRTYIDMINTCTGVNMSPDDNFPQLICLFCIEQLGSALAFNTKCHTAQNALTKLLPRMKDAIFEIKCEEIKTETNSLDGFEEKIQTEDVYEVEIMEESIETRDLEEFNPEFNNGTLINPELRPTKIMNLKSDIEQSTKKCTTITNIHNCPICVTSYSGYGILLKHRKLHANTCWKCTIVFNNQNEYDEHMKIHNRTDCPECGKVFAKRHQYTMHMRIHTKEKHICTICGKKFSLMGSLTAHLRIHTGEKIYKCAHCEKKFMRSGDRREHVRSFHTKENPNECHHCQKRFTSSNSLLEHTRIHTGERPYPCKLCDMKFIRLGSLKIHMYNQHKDYLQ